MENNEKEGLSDTQKLEKASELDRFLEPYMASLEKKLKHIECWPELKWEDEIEKHPLQVKENKEPDSTLKALYEIWEKLKYHSEKKTHEELALSYKEDGNVHFKNRNYRLAIAIYTEGIKIKCGNKDIETALLNNRAAASCFLKNYNSSLKDCESVLKLKSDHEKTLSRGAHCSYNMMKYEDAIKYCKVILEKNKDNKAIVTLLEKSVLRYNSLKVHLALELRKNIDGQILLDAIKSRGIKFFRFEENDYEFKDLQPTEPRLLLNRVHIYDKQKLVWPVKLIYPEYNLMYCVGKLHEDQILYTEAAAIILEKHFLGIRNEFFPPCFSIYFPNYETGELFPVSPNQTLGEVLKDKNFFVRHGTPTFIIGNENYGTEEKLFNSQIE